MGLCALCKSIPLENLPPIPSKWTEGMCIKSWTMPNEWYLDDEEDQRLFPKDPFGFQHQSSFEALAISADTCELCALMNESVTARITEYESREAYPVFQMRLKEQHRGDYQLWLTKRVDDGDGFLVFARVGCENLVILVAAIGPCVDYDDPLGSTFAGRPVKPDADTEEVKGRAISWVETCLSTHTHCHSSKAPLPSRVLELEASLATVSLVETEGAEGRYATLSHCWGRSGHFTTTNASISERKAGMPVASLPKTFRDAINIYVQVGIRYLWIDSLCILQDDRGDWEHESSKMAAVYANSYLTISAASAKDNSIGCFSTRHERKHIQINYVSPSGMKGTLQAFQIPVKKGFHVRKYDEMFDEPLTTRAWVLQERKMSQRILHFCSDQMYFECNHGLVGEDGVMNRGRYNSIYPGPFDTEHSIYHDNQANVQLWYKLLGDYSGRLLTKVQDKLPAMSGLASIFGSILDDHYVAGLWSRSLVEGLAWQSLEVHIEYVPSPSSTYIAPSWSWAAYPGYVSAGFRSRYFKDIATVLEYHTTLKDPENPYGEITDGRILIRAPLMPLSLERQPETDESKWHVLVTTPSGAVTDIRIDRVRESGAELRASLDSKKLFALMLRGPNENCVDPEDPRPIYIALVVTPVDGDQLRMRRLGIIYFLRDELGSGEILDDTDGFVTITLI